MQFLERPRYEGKVTGREATEDKNLSYFKRYHRLTQSKERLSY